MKKFMVTDTCGCEIGHPYFFDTMEKAQIHLFNLFLEACRHLDADDYNKYVVTTKEELEKAIDSLIDNDIFDDENNFEGTCAWAETTNHDNWDGKIFEIEI